MKKITFETKNIDEALTYASQELKAPKEQIEIEIDEEKKNIFGVNKQYTVTAYVKFDAVMEGLNYLKTILADMGIDALVEAKKNGDNDISYIINSEENPLLIGKNGKTLESVQILTRNLVNLYQDEESKYNVLVDIGGYKEQRKRQLEILATKTAKEVAKSKIPAALKPMNSYERRIIHTKLSDWRDVITESAGEEPDRYVVIKPREK